MRGSLVALFTAVQTIAAPFASAHNRPRSRSHVSRATGSVSTPMV